MKTFKKKEKKKQFFIVAIATMALLVLIVGITYAVYQEETEITFINTKVRWPNADEISYTTTNNNDITNVEQALNDLYERLGN